MLLRLLTSILLLWLSFADAKDGRPIRNTIDGVHCHMVYDRDVPVEKLYSIKYHKSVASRYDYIWGTEAAMGAVGHQHFQTGMCYDILYAFDSEDNRTCDYWKKNHPDWVMYKGNKQDPAYINDGLPRAGVQCPLDIRQDAVLDNQLDEWLPEADANHVDSFCIDRLNFKNHEQRVGRFQSNNQWEEVYSGKEEDDKYFSDQVSWFKRMQDKLAARGGNVRNLVPAFAFKPQGQKKNFLELLPNIDGIYDEGGFTNIGKEQKSGDKDSLYDNYQDFIARINMMKGVQSTGKPYLLQQLYPSPPTPDEEEYAVGSYLIGKEDQATVWTGTRQDYGVDNYRKIYQVPIGRPCGHHKVVGTTVRRTYSRGIVVCSADNKKKGYWRFGEQDLPLTEYSSGKDVSAKKIRLPPHTCKIYLFASERPGCATGEALPEEKAAKAGGWGGASEGGTSEGNAGPGGPPPSNAPPPPSGAPPRKSREVHDQIFKLFD